MIVQMGKKYQTRDGRPVRILATDLKGGGVLTVIGLVMNKNENEMIETWTTDGHVIAGRDNPIADLIPVPRRREGWAVFQGMPYIFETREDAEHQVEVARGKRIIAHVTWED